MAAPPSDSVLQIKQVAPLLLAAGVGTDVQATYLLETKDSALVSKTWSGRSFTGDAELIAGSDIRPNSSAAYLLVPPLRYIIAISASSTLRGLKYDTEEEEWVDDPALPSIPVHPEGHIAASLDTSAVPLTPFQNPVGKLVYADAAWKTTVIDVANPVRGSPLHVVPMEAGRVDVYYVSATDHAVHFVTKGADDTWSDAAFAPATLKATPKNLTVMKDTETGKLQALVLTQGSEILSIRHDEPEAQLWGNVEADGNFVPKVSTECGVTLCRWPPYPGWPNPGPFPRIPQPPRWPWSC